MNLTPTQANEIFELMFSRIEDERGFIVGLGVLKSLKIDINDVIEKVDFLNFSKDFHQEYSWKKHENNAKKSSQKNSLFNPLFLEHYYFKLIPHITINEKNLFKILEHTNPEQLGSLLLTLCRLRRLKESEKILPTNFLDEILKITNFKIYKNRYGGEENLLIKYVDNLSFQEVRKAITKNYGYKPLLNPRQLQYVIERSDVVFRKPKLVASIVSDLINHAFIGPIAPNMEKNLELIFKKINPKKYSFVLDDAIGSLMNFNGIQILEKMDKVLNLNWRDYIQEKHVRGWEKNLILQILNKKDYIPPLFLKNHIEQIAAKDEILQVLMARQIREEKKSLNQNITKKSKNNIEIKKNNKI